MNLRRIVPLTVCLALLAACGSPKLVTKPSAPPPGLHLSGNWVLSANTGFTQPAARDQAVHVFLKTGDTMKVSQAVAGLFISFDRSVVGEYRFGENREIHVGEITAERASGWDGDSYLIETVDEDGAMLTDRYRLIDEGEHLERTIEIKRGKRTLLDRRLVYDRAWEWEPQS